MSFFRASQDVSESEDTNVSRAGISASYEDVSVSRVRTIGSNASLDVDTSDAFSPSSAPASFHTMGLIHSLLEERCLYQAVTELQQRGIQVDSIQDPQVRALGHRKYLRVSRSLGGLGVIKQGFESQHYSPLRQNYLDGLDLLAQQTSTPSRPQMQKAVSQMDLALPETFRKYVTATRDMNELDDRLNRLSVDGRAPGNSLPAHPLLDETKYNREFEEFGMLGKGGYGVVFHVEHKLDGGSYAIKKVPVNHHRIRRIQQHGQSEMDEILLELRTLARLSHPNVVRYHTGWIEYAVFSSQRSASLATIDGQKLLQAPDALSRTSAVTTPSIDIQFEFDADDDIDSVSQPSALHRPSAKDDTQGIIFDYSSDGRSDVDDLTNSLSTRDASFRDNALQQTRSRQTIASVSDGEVEFVPRREVSSSSSGLEESLLSNDERAVHEPCLALHIQMSLYSMTLADFLSPSNGNVDSSAISSLRHCFHSSASLLLLLAIMDGIRYLHKEGIVHRDLKPGNIFLAVRPGTDSPPGAIDLSLCKHCNKSASSRPYNMDVCIGDFGLVSSVAKAEDDNLPLATPSRIVGTETYRPDSITRDNHPCLDVFALGIIAFELLWSFSTRMERHETLHKLKKGELPEGFDEKVHCHGLAKYIKSMVMATENHCPSLMALRQDGVELLARCER
ncbi:hypothetical protein AAFC00_006855 [Neodothiora populina]|uniref:Protein kinase domain-containing protein n=1 Tax=Neodothiora populina TaxID=2781224 RepID=A0ABR3PBI0_9PEZI